MRASLDELDGVFTYICVTKDALGVAKDEMAAKPLVLYESDDLVALASEEIAIRAIIDHEIDTYDPYEGEVLVWTALTGEPAITYDARGLAEPDDTRPERLRDRRRPRPSSTPRDLTTRQINLELRWLIYEQGISDVTVQQPRRQALARRRHPDALPDHASTAASATSAAGSSTAPRSTSRAASAGRRART